MKHEPSSLANHFLIAMPDLDDPNFKRTVTYLCEHNKNGAMGFIINRPINVTLKEILEHMQIPHNNGVVGNQSVLYGGPAQPERGFVIHPTDTQWESSLAISEHISITTSKDVLQSLGQGKGPDNALIALGYAGWEAGQLEEELHKNSWLCAPADPKILFDTPFEKRWEKAAGLIGVDLERISFGIGHA